MTTKVALEHRTTYRFDRALGIGPHVIRLRPAPHTRTPVESYSLTIEPGDHFLNWQQDPFGNHLARAVFPSPSAVLDITVGLVADLTVINPFDFFVEDHAATYPFRYGPDLEADLAPYLAAPVDAGSGSGSGLRPQLGPQLDSWLDRLPARRASGQPVVEFLGELNAAVNRDVAYSTRMEEGVLSPEQTLSRGVGSCRDSAWLLVTALRHYGLAARFVSGYLVQLASDQPDSGGPAEDFTDLHAWAEVYLPGAGWIGLDATSALFAGEGHIPLAATPQPRSAAPITGATEPSVTTMAYSNTVRRVHEDPRVTRPYTVGQTAALHRLGHHVDARLAAAGLELTMGGEPTFVSVDDMTSAQWTVAADGPDKRQRARGLARSLAQVYGRGGLVQHGQGKWYPGESEPRWQIGLVWRSDGEPLWHDPALLAEPGPPAEASAAESTSPTATGPAATGPAATDPAPGASSAASPQRAADLAREIARAFGLPPDAAQPCYEDPLAELVREAALPAGPRLVPAAESVPGLVERLDGAQSTPVAWALPLVPSWFGDAWASPAWRTRRGRLVLVPGAGPAGARLPLTSLSWHDPDYVGEESYASGADPLPGDPPRALVADPEEVRARTAVVVEPRQGRVHVFLPPLEQLDRFVELVGVVEQAAAALATPVVLEGYGPPPDPRVTVLTVTPDPGVIEVNVHPTAGWGELSELTTTLFRLAREQRLGAETFALDGRHSGTGGGNHLTLGGPEPARSPLLRRPDLLVSLITFWQHHPGLSYLFSGRFVGPTSQAPRVDEGRPETLYELETAFAELERLPDDERRPWAVDRALRHLLTDVTGNTHRSEFCVDKLYSPDSTRGRLGLLELRGFEMPPHPEMALVQALLVRALVARFAEEPYAAPLVRWGGALHDRYLLPHYVWADVAQVVADLRAHDLDVDLAWLSPYLEFRFPLVGRTTVAGVGLELRQAIEPWHVLGEEAGSGGTARYVDSSTERLQVSVAGFVPERQLLLCNGRPVPLTATGTPGGYVAGIRFKAWSPWSALHPSLGVDPPLQLDLVDRAAGLSLGGATYHVVHPGGRSYGRPPINALDAEARRARRFEPGRHTPGPVDVDALTTAEAWRSAGAVDAPLTLDLRRREPRRWGRR